MKSRELYYAMSGLADILHSAGAVGPVSCENLKISSRKESGGELKVM
jgi:hypothetical protein